MEAYAVIETGGKQYRVSKGDTLDVERLEAEAGTQVRIERVLAVSDGASLTVGAPVVPGAAVVADVVDRHRDKKVVVFKKKRRKGYHKKMGHRQEKTRLLVADIAAG